MINGNIGLTTPNVRGSDLVLGDLGTKYVRTGDLHSNERVMAVNLASAHIIDNRFGSMSHYQPGSPQLPEVVQGVLADFAS